jgi:hypothetical protein
MQLGFDSNDNCVISTAVGSAFTVTGTGKFVTDGDMWGNIPRNVMHLTYIVREGANHHAIKDTLVVRDRDVRFEEFIPIVYQ